MIKCPTYPAPDSDAASSGLTLVSDQNIAIREGEYAVYNCTDAQK